MHLKFYIFLGRVRLYRVDDVSPIFNLIRKTRRYYEIFTDFLNIQGKVNRKNAIWIYLIRKLLSLFLYSRKVFKIKSSFRSNVWFIYKVGCVFPMAVVSRLPHAEFGQNGHHEDALYFQPLGNQWLSISKDRITSFWKVFNLFPKSFLFFKTPEIDW